MYFIGSRIQGRLTMGSGHPNYLGLICFGFLMSALALQSLWMAIGLISVNLFVIVETQSRSALAAALLGLAVFAAFKLNRLGKKRAGLALASIAFVGAVLLLVYFDAVQEGVSSLFFLGDKNRGLGTGFTGRIGAWQETLDLFLENPFFGVGFRMHERYMTVLTSAHNGYLSLLAEVGIVGALPILMLVAILWWRLGRGAVAGDHIAMLGFSCVAGYLFVAAFERLFLNMGNPTSILSWIFLLIWDRSVDSRSKIREKSVRWPPVRQIMVGAL
jgi:O-antigen ligase